MSRKKNPLVPVALFIGLIICAVVICSTLTADAPRKPDAPKLEIAPAADAPPDFSGIYSVVGKEKEPYGGSVTLMQLAPNVYKVSWSLTTGDWTGAGLYQGGVLSVGWIFPGRDGVTMRGVHSMTPHGKDGLAGAWISLPGTGKANPEAWSKLGKVPAPSEH